MNLRTMFGAAAAVLLLALGARSQSLGVGDSAPRMRVSSWVRGGPIESFERDRVYVVEFWATWCLPCVRTIPHLTAVQKRFAGRGVRIVGVSVWEDRQADVATFVAELGAQVGYAIATDSVLPGAKPMQGTMALSWLRAAGENSLPTAFIVDGAGKIAWIGDTLSVEEPLQQVVAGTWDMQAARAAHATRVKVNALTRRLTDELKAREWIPALATIEQINGLAPESEVRTAAWRFQALLGLGREDEAYAYATRSVDTLLWNEALQLNLVAWFIVDPEEASPHRRDLDFALRVARRAVDLTESKNAAILDTLALVHFERGEIDQAFTLQEQAVALAVEPEWLVKELVARLELYRAAKTPPQGNGERSDGLALR